MFQVVGTVSKGYSAPESFPRVSDSIILNVHEKERVLA